MVLYLDLFFINNTLMSFLILWTVGRLLKLEYSILSLITSSIIATIYAFIVYWFKLTLKDLNILLQITLNITAAWFMVKIAFNIKRNKKLLAKTVGLLYIVSFISIGSSISLLHIMGFAPLKISGIIISISSLILFGHLGWYYFQAKISPDNYYLPIIIYISSFKIRLKALVDTGNHLIDPVNKRPVIIVESKQLSPILPEAWQQNTLKNKGILEQANILSNHGLGKRVRLIPCKVIGDDNELILGIRPDKIKIDDSKGGISKNVIIGLTNSILDKNNDYQALLHPEIVELARR